MTAPSWPSDVVPEWYPTHDRRPELTLPRGVFDKYGPNGEAIETPTDHRLLWHLENRLALAPDTPCLRETYSLLLAYLQGNCQHHWLEYEAEAGSCEAHRQCLWCNTVLGHPDTPDLT